MVSAIQAIKQSGLMESTFDPTRVGVSIGSGIGGLTLIENTTLLLKQRGPRKVSPFFVPGSIINMIAGNLAIKYGFQGPNIAITTTPPFHTLLGFGARMIAYGDADIVIAGGAEKRHNLESQGFLPHVPCRHAMTIRRLRAVHGIKIVMALCWLTEQQPWFSKTMSQPKRAVPTLFASWLALV